MMVEKLRLQNPLDIFTRNFNIDLNKNLPFLTFFIDLVGNLLPILVCTN